MFWDHRWRHHTAATTTSKLLGSWAPSEDCIYLHLGCLWIINPIHLFITLHHLDTQVSWASPGTDAQGTAEEGVEIPLLLFPLLLLLLLCISVCSPEQRKQHKKKKKKEPRFGLCPPYLQKVLHQHISKCSDGPKPEQEEVISAVKLIGSCILKGLLSIFVVIGTKVWNVCVRGGL